MEPSNQNQYNYDMNSRPSSSTAPPPPMPLITLHNQPPPFPPPLHYQPPQFTFQQPPTTQYYQPPPPEYYQSPPPPPPQYYYHHYDPTNVPMIYDWSQGAPSLNIAQHSFGQPWSTGLFDCLLDSRSCLMGTCCPWISFGEVAEIVTQGNTPWYEPAFFYAFLAVCFVYPTCLYSSCYRTRVRRTYDLEGSRIEDFVLHCLCEPCALCSVYRELQHRGFDLSIGWAKNKERERPVMEAVFQAPPVVEQGMRR